MIKMKSLLMENPEYIKINNKKIASMFDHDAITFGYYKNLLKIKGLISTGNVEVHDELYRKISRYKLKFPGRLWYIKKIISFWGKYPSREELQILINDIKNWNTSLKTPIQELNSLNINSIEWKIEVPSDSEIFFGLSSDKSKLLPLKEYKNSGLQFKEVDHIKSPMIKSPEPHTGFGSDKTYDGLTQTQYHQIKSTSESKE